MRRFSSKADSTRASRRSNSSIPRPDDGGWGIVLTPEAWGWCGFTVSLALARHRPQSGRQATRRLACFLRLAVDDGARAVVAAINAAISLIRLHRNDGV